MDKEEILAEYNERKLTFNKLEEETKHILTESIKQTSIKFHSIISRVKTIESFLAKIDRKETDSPFQDITDIVALRIVCLLRSDIENIGKIIKNEFNVIDEEDKIDGYEINSFGYQSFHYIATIKSNYSGLRYDSIKDISFEIQIRTLAMDAWASTSHFLDYKSDKDVPSELRRDFYALSGLFYVADTHFELFYKESQKSKIRTQEDFTQSTDIPDVEINLDTLSSYLFSKFSDRREVDSMQISRLVHELYISGYTNIGDLNVIIDENYDAFLRYEKDNPPSNKKRFASIGVIRLLLTIADKNFRKFRGISNKDAKTYTKYLNFTE